MTSQLYGYKTAVHNYMCMCRQWTQAILSQLWGSVIWENKASTFYAAVVSVLVPYLSTPLITTLAISSAVLLTLGGLQATPVLCMVRCWMGVPLSVLKALPSILIQVNMHCADTFLMYIGCVGRDAYTKHEEW